MTTFVKQRHIQDAKLSLGYPTVYVRPLSAIGPYL